MRLATLIVLLVPFSVNAESPRWSDASSVQFSESDTVDVTQRIFASKKRLDEKTAKTGCDPRIEEC